MALHVLIACAHDPSVDSAFGVFPAADDIDIWACDPPEISSFLGLPLPWVVDLLVAVSLASGFSCFPDCLRLRAKKRRKNDMSDIPYNGRLPQNRQR